MKMPEQGELLKFDDTEAHVNTFTPEEMTTIYVAVKQLKELGEEMIRAEYGMRNLTKSERKQCEADKRIVHFARCVLNKLEPTFGNMEVDLSRFE